MLRHVLLPLEPGSDWKPVVDRLRPILSHPGTEVTLVGAAQPPLGAGLGAADVADQLKLEAEVHFRAVAAELRASGLTVRQAVGTGAPEEVIVAEARQRPLSMVAMATHARRGIARMALGSVAESVVRTAPVPVLLIRLSDDPGKPPVPPISIRKILVAIDGGEFSLGIARWVAELARACRAAVTLTWVLAPRPATGPDLEAADRVFAAGRKRFRSEGIEVETLLLSGDPAEEITQACREKGFDLVACTTHGRTGLARWVLGSVAEQIVRTSEVPVLVARG